MSIRVAGVRLVTLVAIGLLLGAGATVWLSRPADAGMGLMTLEVVKVVDGDAPEGEFVIEVRCDTDGTTHLMFDGPGTQALELVPDTQD